MCPFHRPFFDVTLPTVKTTSIQLDIPPSQSLRVLTLQSFAGSTIKILWGAVAGKDYEVQRRSTVNSEGWETVGHVHTSSNSGEWEEATSPDAVSRFYRVRIQ